MQLNDREKTLYVYGPKGINKLVSQLLSLGYFKPSYEIVSHELNDKDILDFDDYMIHTMTVDHNVPTLAYALEEYKRPGRFNKTKALELGIPEGPMLSKPQRGQSIVLDNGKKIIPNMVLGPPRSGRKIVISGDTRPYNKLIDFSKNADVLIHDSTFDSEFEDIARDYGHSTASQAANIAKKANVERLFLTHISPRYLDHRILEKDARKIFKNSYVPKDFQEIEIKLKK